MSDIKSWLHGCVLDFQNLAESNVELENKIRDLKDEMREGEREIEKTTDEYMKLKVKLSVLSYI